MPFITYAQDSSNKGLDFVEQNRINWIQQLDENPDERFRNFMLGSSMLYTNADSALHYFMLAEQQMVGQDSCQEFAIQLYLQLGKAFYILGEYASSFEINLLALRCANNRKYWVAKAKALNQIGAVLTMQNKFQEARNYHNEAFQIASEERDSALMAAIWVNQAVVYVTQKQYLEAIPILLQASHYFERTTNNYMYSKVLNHLGYTYLNLGRTDDARACFTKAARHLNTGNDWETCYAFAGLSRLALYEDDPDLAIQYADSGMSLAMHVNARWDILQLTKALEDAWLAKGDYKKAYEMFGQYQEYWKAIYNTQTSREINYLWVKLKDIENKRLQSENAQLQKQQTWTVRFLIVLIAFFLSLVLVGILLNRKNRLKEKFYTLVESKNKEIRTINRKLEESLITKDKLFSIIAHDLKGPMGSFISFTDHIQQNIGEYDTETLVEIIKSMNKSSRQSYRLLVNLLDWSRAQAGNLHMEHEWLPLAEMIQEQLDVVEGNAFNKKIKLNNEVAGDFKIYADRNMIQAILRNLISNAVKYCTEGDSVTISAGQSGKYYQLDIVDTGIGMTESQLAILNNPHAIYSTPGTNNESGTGLGFLIISDFVERHQGEMEIESQPGNGTAVKIKLPVPTSTGA